MFDISYIKFLVFPSGSDSKEFTCNMGDLDSVPGLGRPPGEGYGKPLPIFQPGKSPWTEEPGGLQSLESQRVRHNCVTKCAHTDIPALLDLPLLVTMESVWPQASVNIEAIQKEICTGSILSILPISVLELAHRFLSSMISQRLPVEVLLFYMEAKLQRP